MTQEELDRLKDMWVGGVTVKEIARELSYGENTIRTYVSRHRDEFPRRYPLVNDEAKREWVSRVKSGQCTVTKAARLAGVTQETIRNWIRRYGR